VNKPADALVFPAPDGGYLRNGNWRARSGWTAATKELGLEGITPHDLRRTFGSLARSAGADLRWIQRAMGHESITTTARIYAHLYDDELDVVAAALDRINTLAKGRGGPA
ncbi:MAG TPA: tyrosine-type recombinase/integrase, partial [Pedococcus sp.]|nr:tyrosine-type recombinase/integrase [Pedococcus sp.]